MSTKKPDLSMTIVRSAEIDVAIGGWLTDPLRQLIEERFPDHEVGDIRVVDWDGYHDGYIQVKVEMGPG